MPGTLDEAGKQRMFMCLLSADSVPGVPTQCRQRARRAYSVQTGCPACLLSADSMPDVSDISKGGIRPSRELQWGYRPGSMLLPGTEFGLPC